jgi:hypothetical protein
MTDSSSRPLVIVTGAASAGIALPEWPLAKMHRNLGASGWGSAEKPKFERERTGHNLVGSVLSHASISGLCTPSIHLSH